MPTVPTEKTATLTGAVKALRLALGDTQQQFAQRLGLAISTAVRYESTRAPHGKALSQLYGLALENKLDKVADMFRRALLAELGTWDTTGLASVGTEPNDDAEKLGIAAFLATMRSPQYVEERPKVLALLRKPAERCIEALAEGRERIKNTVEVDRLLKDGMEPAAIAQKLKLDEKQVRARAILSRFPLQ